MSGIMKLLAAIAVLLIAGLAMLLVFDVISVDAFGEYLKNVVLMSAIIALTAVALGFLFKGKD